MIQEIVEDVLLASSGIGMKIAFNVSVIMTERGDCVTPVLYILSTKYNEINK